LFFPLVSSGGELQKSFSGPQPALPRAYPVSKKEKHISSAQGMASANNFINYREKSRQGERRAALAGALA